MIYVGAHVSLVEKAIANAALWKSAFFYLQTALLFTWLWFLQIAKKNPHVDNWFWGQEGITCGKTESEPDCLNRQDWSVTEKTVEAIKNDQPTLTFIHFGRFRATSKLWRKDKEPLVSDCFSSCFSACFSACFLTVFWLFFWLIFPRIRCCRRRWA